MSRALTYREAKKFLLDASGLISGGNLDGKLLASPGKLAPFDSSTAGELPDGDAFGDEMLRALLVVRRHLVGQKMIERDMAGILTELTLSVRVLGAKDGHENTRIPQLSRILDVILHLHGEYGSDG